MSGFRLTQNLKEEFKNLLGDGVSYGVSLAGCTTLGVGGPADILAEVGDEEQLRGVLLLCHGEGIPCLVIGGGSNLLVRDGGWRGAAIKLAGKKFRRIRTRGSQIIAGGAAPTAGCAAEAEKCSLSGLEFLSGIPGTVGGAIRMNAGAGGSCIGDRVERSRMMKDDGKILAADGRDMGFSYRECAALRGAILLEATLALECGDAEKIREEGARHRDERAARLPAGRSAGCVFRNPRGGPSAGELIEEAGLKGARAGGAVVSEEHANVIVNHCGATAADVLSLIRLARERVRGMKGIDLETELIIAGEEIGSN